VREAEKENSKALFRRYKPYPAYKDSGVEWLREVPKHWDCSKLKRIASLAYGDSFVGQHHFNGGYKAYGSNGIIGESIIFNAVGPCIIIGRKGSFGKINYSRRSCFAIDTTFYIDNNLTKSNMRWLYYCFQLLGLDSLSKDSAVPGLSREEVYGRQIPYPDVEEQKVIAAFLDNETAKIDALIAKQERLIDLLQEKRAALISHAVTKGLDPKAPMKDSGVVWLGEIPAHWELKRTKYLFRIMSGSTPNSSEPDYWNGDLPWVTPEDLGVLDGFIISETRRNITLNGYLSCATNMVPVGSIIVSTRAPIGHIAIAQVELCTNQGCRALIPSEGLDSRYFYHIFSVAKQELQSFGQGSTFRELSKADLGSLLIPRPPLREQELISEALGKKTSEMDGVIKKTRASIKLLKEYRTALISAAVTGKIDVREEVSSA